MSDSMLLLCYISINLLYIYITLKIILCNLICVEYIANMQLTKNNDDAFMSVDMLLFYLCLLSYYTFLSKWKMCN